ncbi:MAG TPA: hypothetical protein VMH05_26905 [Bryobacteraceae bacterium]|nr:hypothetical protein [Bryobacteraceae bacterium]
MAAVRIHKVFISPDGREKVELFGPKEGLYGFRLWQRKRKAWRRMAEACQHDCYVSLSSDAGERVSWLRRLRSYELEHLRGLTFEYALYTGARFGGDHDRCVACPAKFMEGDWPNVLHIGYVTRCRIPHGSTDDWVWTWVCDKCFSDLRDEMQWQLEETNQPAGN